VHTVYRVLYTMELGPWCIVYMANSTRLANMARLARLANMTSSARLAKLAKKCVLPKGVGGRWKSIRWCNKYFYFSGFRKVE